MNAHDRTPDFSDEIRRIERNMHRVQPKAWLHILAIATVVASVLVSLPAKAQTVSPAVPLVIGNDAEPDSYSGVMGRLMYAEISKRLAIPMEVRTYPEQRRSALADSGAIDGETVRIYAYGSVHPNLVRVEESLIDLGFSLYTADPALKLQGLSDPLLGKLRVEYRRGVLFCEKTLKPVLPVNRLSDVAEPKQGAKKLLAGRTDVFCDLDADMISVLHDPEIKGVSNVRTLLEIGTVPTYPYLHKRLADLAPRMAAVIKQMKAEGLIEQFKRQAERELGWTR